MENFVVSARKYRPQSFDTVVGQEHITTTLKNAIKNSQLAHAFLFCGPRGVGKTTCARILAKTVNCENRTPEGEACNECNSCKTFMEGQSINIFELDAASNNSVDDIRELTEQVRYLPQSGKYKIYIIDEVHMLSQQAFNAFLKTLEEPPSYAIFILATTEKHKILPTILSRCQVFDFRRMTAPETVGHLKTICDQEEIQSEEEALHLIAQKSEGCMRDALSILDKVISFTNGQVTYKNALEHLNVLDYEYFFRINQAVDQQDAAETLLIFDEILQKGFDGGDFLEGYSAFLRDLLVSKDKRVVHLMEVTESLKERYQKAATEMDTGFLVSALNLLNDTGIQFKQARNKRLLMETSLIRLAYLHQAVSLLRDEQSGLVSKKKVIQNKPVLLRAGFPVKIKGLNTAKPISLSKAEEKSDLTGEKKVDYGNKKEAAPAAASLIEKKPTDKKAVTSATPSKKNKPRAPRKRKTLDLSSLRSEVEEERGNTSQVQQVRPLEENELQQIWKQHIERLKHHDKNQAANNMDLATVHIAGETKVEIVCRNAVQRSFLKDQKVLLAEELKTHFNNKRISVFIKVDNSLREKEEVEVLTQRQMLDKMIEKNPVIKDLKEGLNLDLG